MNKCNIISDLLPLYVEDLVGDDSKVFIENHIDTCKNCKKELENLASNNNTKENLDKKPLEFLNKNIEKSKKSYGFTIAMMVASFLLILVSFLTNPIHFDSSRDLYTVEEYEESIVIVFNEKVTNYDFFDNSVDNSGQYFIDGYTTRLDRILNLGKTQAHTFSKDEISRIYYNNHNKPYELIWGEESPEDGQGFLLPRLVLNMYFLIALVILGVLLISLLIYRFLLKKNLSIVNVAVIIGIPISYLLSTISIKGFSGGATHYLIRDLFFITILATAYYLLIISISKIIKNKYLSRI